MQTRTGGMLVLEGPDGCGKGEQSRRLLARFTERGYDAQLTREPGGSPAAEEIRQLLVQGDPEKWDAMTELLLMYAARRAHLRDRIWPALAAGQWLIVDRYADSSRAYQGIAGGLGLERVNQLHELVVGDFEPNLVLVLDVPAELSLARAKARGNHEDRFERKGLAYHQRVREAYLQLVEGNPDHYYLLDGGQTMDEVERAIIQAIEQRLGLDLS